MLASTGSTRPPSSIAPKSPVQLTIGGSVSVGTPNSRHSRSSHSPPAMFISEVREAVVMSVTQRPVSRCRKNASVVPSRSRPSRCSRAASGTLRYSQASLVAEK